MPKEWHEKFTSFNQQGYSSSRLSTCQSLLVEFCELRQYAQNGRRDFMFYDTFVFLCKRKGLSPSKAAIDAKISKSLVTKWKTNGTEVPSPEVLKKLSVFFGVTPDYLLGYDTQSQIDTLSEQISQLKIELRSASPDRRGELESSLSILEESLDDLVFAQAMSSSADNSHKKISPTEQTLDEGTQRLIDAIIELPPEKQKALADLIGVDY